MFGRRFRVEERIAAGGFGVIYRASHLKSNYEVALKMLHDKMLRDERVVARFRREAATLTTLRSKHTVTTYELVEEPDGKLFMVMELLRGETLYQKYQREGTLPWRQVLDIGLSVCASLAEAHALGVVHRDLKPENIVLEPRDGEIVVKVLDFGIAKVLPGSELESQEELTNHNEVIGTFDYISPEQIRGDEYSGRSDIYTLGVVMYEMITGSRPFSQVSGPALMVSILNTTAPLPSTRLAGLPPALDRVLLHCLEPDPAKRFEDVAELAAAIEATLAVKNDEHATAQVVLPPEEDQTQMLSKPRPALLEDPLAPPPPPLRIDRGHAPPYATPMGMPVVAMSVQPARAEPLLDSGPIEPPPPRASHAKLPAVPPPLPPPRVPLPLVTGWATTQRQSGAPELAQPQAYAPAEPFAGGHVGTPQPGMGGPSHPQPAYGMALERDRMMSRILWGTLVAIVIGVLLALVVR